MRHCRHCGDPFAPPRYQLVKGDYECPPCKRARQNARNATRDLAAYSRARNAKPETKAALRAYAERKKSDPLYRLKRAARRKVGTEIEAGRLVRQPCVRCGEAKAQAHHHSYSRPLDVTWLCRRCHWKEEHRADSIAV